ncbi:hypothetical protein GE09DRAFT_1239529 [Coniochaeta sp. 2T2.1]|nr:hypothetical protein GE09DRAFT_1239529 [Coniochaeta sp. 2T2.1]
MYLTVAKEETAQIYPYGLKLTFIVIGLFGAVLCVGLDRAIINTAVPKITTEYNSLPDIGFICSIASGLTYRFSMATSTAYWPRGRRRLPGGRHGNQTVLTGKDVAIGSSVVFFATTIFGTIFYSVSNNVLQDKLIRGLERRVPEVEPAVVIAAGANNLVYTMGEIYPTYVDGIFESYEKALQSVFLIAVVLAAVSASGSLFVERRGVKQRQAQNMGVGVEVAGGGDGEKRNKRSESGTQPETDARIA